MIKEPDYIPTYYTTPPDWKKCGNFDTVNAEGPTPCWHPHCDCFPPEFGEDVRTKPRDLALFLFIVAAIIALLVLFSKPAGSAEYEPPYWQCNGSHETNDPRCPEERKQKPGPVAKYSCEIIANYLATHTEEEARAKAKELHLPQWLIRKAEKCPR